MNRELADLADAYWDTRLAHDPLYATLVGDHRFDELMPDLSEAAEAAYADRLESLHARLDDIDAELDDDDRVTLECLRHELDVERARVRCASLEFQLAPSIVGATADLFHACPKVVLRSRADATAVVVRYHAVATYLRQAAERLRAGVGRGRTPTAKGTAGTIRQLDEYLASPLEADPLVALGAPADMDAPAAAAWRDELVGAVRAVVRPAVSAYRDVLAAEVLPSARPPDRSGLCWVPDGEAAYARLARWATTTDAAPEALHQRGLDAVAALAEEYGEVGGRCLGITDPPTLFARLRDDPALRFSTSQEVLEAARAALDRANAAVPAWFGRLPQAPCVVVEMPAHEVKDGTIAYYSPPATDGSRPGGYYVNTYAPETRPRFEAEALAFHEAVPGHHLQIAIAQELDGMPAFRRLGEITAYVEGWALYIERLADEMGLYSGDLDRLGMLSFDSWRAGRMVVDTGLHRFGWSRERAIAYLTEHSPLALNNITNEVDRYIGWPAQALGYKVGQQALVRLRREAREALGPRFDARGFHDAVLGLAPVPLAVLETLVREWITLQRT